MNALLEDVKNYLDITWEDAGTDKKLGGILARGQEYLQRKTGERLDFAVEGMPRALLFDYCRYAHNGVTELFEKNFASQITSLRIAAAVRAAEEAEGL